MNKVTAIVPARGGSKRIANKNLREVAGKPLVKWTLDFTHSAGLRTILSSNDPQILAIGQEISEITIHHRSADMSGDETSMEDTVLSIIKDLDLQPSEKILLLQPSSPLRNMTVFKAFMDEVSREEEKFGEHQYFSVTQSYDDYWIKESEHWIRIREKFLTPEYRSRSTQKRDSIFIENGLFYLTSVQKLQELRSFVGPGARAISTPLKYHLDINTEEDLEMAASTLCRNFPRNLT